MDAKTTTSVDEAVKLLASLSLQESTSPSIHVPSYNWAMDHGDGSGRMRRYSGTVGTIDLPDFRMEFEC